jgi:methylglutaconyl-CoA hydratase
MSDEHAREYTAETIARLRVSEEGQEGLSAFLEKRKPRWIIAAEGE